MTPVLVGHVLLLGGHGEAWLSLKVCCQGHCLLLLLTLILEREWLQRLHTECPRAIVCIFHLLSELRHWL